MAGTARLGDDLTELSIRAFLSALRFADQKKRRFSRQRDSFGGNSAYQIEE